MIIRDAELLFLARHGRGHSVPPHLINYRANIQALRDLKVKKIIATAAVGSLNEKMAPPCDFVLVDQFLDFTKHVKVRFMKDVFGVWNMLMSPILIVPKFVIFFI